MDQNGTFPATDANEIYFQSIVILTSLVIPLIAILALYANMLIRLWKGSAALSQGPGPTRDSRNSGRGQENKKRVTRMIVAVIIVFTVCWTPLHIVLALKAFGKYDDHLYESLVIFMIFAQCLAYFNSCLNPLLYAFFSPNFRSAFWSILSRSPILNQTIDDKNSRRKASYSQGRLLASRDNGIGPSSHDDNLLDRQKRTTDNNIPKIALEMLPLPSTNLEVCSTKNVCSLCDVFTYIQLCM